MADILVSYSRKDDARVEMLVRALMAHDISVWWDRSLEQGTNFAALIRKEISDAKVVIVCWSEAASQSQWVLDEADEAKHLGKYVGCLIAQGRAAMGFNTLNNANLLTWNGAADDRQLLALLREVGRRINRKDVAELAEAEDARLAEEDKRRRAEAEATRVSVERRRQRTEEQDRRRAKSEADARDRLRRWVVALTKYTAPLAVAWISWTLLYSVLGLPGSPSWALLEIIQLESSYDLFALVIIVSLGAAAWAAAFSLIRRVTDAFGGYSSIAIAVLILALSWLIALTTLTA